MYHCLLVVHTIQAVCLFSHAHLMELTIADTQRRIIRYSVLMVTCQRWNKFSVSVAPGIKYRDHFCRCSCSSAQTAHALRKHPVRTTAVHHRVLVVQAITAIILGLQCAAEFIVQNHISAVNACNNAVPVNSVYGVGNVLRYTGPVLGGVSVDAVALHGKYHVLPRSMHGEASCSAVRVRAISGHTVLPLPSTLLPASLAVSSLASLRGSKSPGTPVHSNNI